MNLNFSTYSVGRTFRCALALAIAIAFPARADRHKFQTSNPSDGKQILAEGGRLIADYGSYQLYEVDTALPGFDGKRGVENRDRFNHIELNAGDLDTTQPGIKALRQSVGPFQGRRMHLVQFAGPVQPAWHAALLGTGVQIVDYIPNNTYLVYGDAAALSRLQTWVAASAFVQWDAPYQKEHRIHPRARPFDAKGQPREIGTDYFTIQLQDDPAANGDTLALIDRLKLAPIRQQSHVMHFVNITVSLAPQSIDAIAGQPDVVSIQPYFVPRKFDERQDQIVAGNLSGSLPSGPGYLSWLASKGFTQAQFDTADYAVDLTDSGIDNGTSHPNHFGLYVSGDTNSSSRVIYNRLEGTPNSGSTIQGCDGHGNINSHIIAGYDDLSEFPFADTNGFHYGLGVCPFVRVGSSVIFDPSTFTNPDYEDLQSRAYRDKVRLSSNSWGADTAGAYDSDSQRYDFLVRDAQPASSAVPNAGNQEMVIVFAAGNAGSGAQTVGSPGTAKNVITVGAAENVQSFGGCDGCAISDAGADSANDIISFSSRGPCADGRQKPEIVAPGTHISGGVSQAASPSSNGTALACFDSRVLTNLGVCGGVDADCNPNNLNGNRYFPAGQQFYTASSGTSHSTPAVAGGCALVRQYFINNFTSPPSPAMTKAYLMNSARYMTGTGANDTLWSANQGMGEMNLGMAFDGVARVLRDELDADRFTASGQTRTFTGIVADPSKPFRVSVAWTDAPGPTSGNAYKNDLDLTVTVGGNTYKGNVFSGANSTTGGAADPRNNAESVFLPAGVSGVFTATVTAANINSDGVPNNADALDQDFALVVYNGSLIFAPVIVADSSTLTAESCSTTNGAIDPGETVTVDLALKNLGAADASNVVAVLLATNGVASPSSPQTYGVLSTNAATVSEPFTFTANGVCGSNITATLQIQTNGTDFTIVTYTFPLGISTFAASTFSNTAAIKIPASGTGSTAGSPSSPYPSAINVSGLPGLINKVTVTLTNISHTFPDDIDILLVGPNGQSVILMSDTGGSLDIVNVTLTFDDAAASSLPDSTQITSGTYKPTNIGSGDAFPSPAPSSGYGSALSVFGGTNPNGTWSLYVVDDASIDTGTISSGWKLSIITSTNTCCVGSINHPPVITAASINPGTPCTTNDLLATVTSTNDPEGDPITLAYQWQESTNNIAFTNLTGQTAGTLGAAVTVAGDYYRVVITPNDGQTNGAPFTTDSVQVATDFDGDGLNDDWEIQYFGSLGAQDGTGDPDGDGFTNAQEQTAGTDPTNPNSALRITAIDAEADDVRITWSAVGGKSYVVQTNAPSEGNFTNDFSDLSAPIAVPGNIETSTNYLDIGGATNVPARFYRLKLLP